MSDMQQVSNVNPASDDRLRGLDATAEEMRMVAKDITTLRGFAFEAYLDAHFVIVEQTTESEWKAITKGVFF
jgi:hypothetical protein